MQRIAGALRAGVWPGLGARLISLAGLSDPLGALARAQLDWMLWAPFALGLGIGAYFALPAEPGPGGLALCIAAALIAAPLWGRGPGPLRFPAVLVLLAAVGLLAADLRAHAVAAPVLGHRYYGPVEGRILRIDRSARDVLRLTLDHVRLPGAPREPPPRTIRIALHGAVDTLDPEPGLVVMTTAHLSPPNGPVAPGGWDFRRNAWFAGLGAVGYTRSPIVVIAPPDPNDWALAAHRLRMHLSAAMQAHIPGQAGAVSAALMTGDRSAITEATNERMRASNLYHIVSISGLHMGMLAGFVFAAIRHGLALFGWLALRWNTKKIAALAALLASTLYLWISGADIATQRAWIMTTVMLTAVLVERRALSLHTVALAAIVLLLLTPEALLGPGFQMSFAATVALVLIARPAPALQNHVPKLLRPALALLLTSLAAGLVTAPIAAAHFGRMSHYGILANMLAVPVMGLVVMPAGVIAACLAPLGLAAPALWVMGKGTEWVLAVAAWVAGLGGAQTALPAPPGWVLPTLALAAGAAVLARGAPRALALAALCAAAAGWVFTPRPALLIASEGALVGVMTPSGRALSKASPGYTAEGWLAADGDTATPDQAAQRPGFVGPRGRRQAEWQGRALVHLTGKGALAALPEACRASALVVLDVAAPKGVSGECTLYDKPALARTGALSLDARGQIRSARAEAGARLWTRPQ
ncbi:ComEC/Rec2 family competence protein [Rhodobacter lacus]|uniref:ComEC/Rec2 family competence protein n=1 Tax=Rhodobacter lacus TaxID=1641972 RepID=A0ABW5A8Q4_9RHOB